MKMKLMSAGKVWATGVGLSNLLYAYPLSKSIGRYINSFAGINEIDYDPLRILVMEIYVWFFFTYATSAILFLAGIHKDNRFLMVPMFSASLSNLAFTIFQASWMVIYKSSAEDLTLFDVTDIIYRILLPIVFGMTTFITVIGQFLRYKQITTISSISKV